jgi:hypothetical protein
MNTLGLSSSVRIAHIASYWKCFLLYYIQILCQHRLWKADHACLTYLMLQRQISHLGCCKEERRAVAKKYAGLLQRRTPSLAQASQFYVVFSPYHRIQHPTYICHKVLIFPRGYRLQMRAELELWSLPVAHDFRHTEHEIWTGFLNNRQSRSLSRSGAMLFLKVYKQRFVPLVHPFS